jgi:hypothetical protein
MARLGPKRTGRVSPLCLGTSDLKFPSNGQRVITARSIPIGREVRFSFAEHGAIAGHATRATSSTFGRTPSQRRSFLWMARLDMAESRVRSCTRSLVRLDQTSLVLSGGLESIDFPLFHRDLARVF